MLIVALLALQATSNTTKSKKLQEKKRKNDNMHRSLDVLVTMSTCVRRIEASYGFFLPESAAYHQTAIILPSLHHTGSD